MAIVESERRGQPLSCCVISYHVTLRCESVRERAHLAHLGFATLGFAYHLVICCTDNMVDGVVSPALIASDSIWAVAEKALRVDRSVRLGSIEFSLVRFVALSERLRMDTRKSI